MGWTGKHAAISVTGREASIQRLEVAVVSSSEAAETGEGRASDSVTGRALGALLLGSYVEHKSAGVSLSMTCLIDSGAATHTEFAVSSAGMSGGWWPGAGSYVGHRSSGVSVSVTCLIDSGVTKLK